MSRVYMSSLYLSRVYLSRQRWDDFTLPAIIVADGRCGWYIDGYKIGEDNFDRMSDMRDL